VPAVAVASEQFVKLARTILRSQKVPEDLVIEIQGNPEFVGEDELARIGARVAEAAVQRFTAPAAGRPAG